MMIDELNPAPTRGPSPTVLHSSVAVLEEQKNEATEVDEVAEKVEDEPNPVEADSSAAEPTSKNETLDEKPDINDVPMEESELILYRMLTTHID
ncbi:hypothetical protein L195_g021045 [Trifolium pratense]|uniref:Uncharacterized protein n=1 Tax=Trifolium pratense TaxID=57577 RepID=A0A2K3N422_TRIPR|nr:hypothetical protein L195_g021045 [Trifolium pratense]